MVNIKQPSERKKNHHNFYLTDDDEKLFESIRKHHSDVTLDKLIMYSLKKIYNNTNYPNDYNAMMITFLSERQSIIKKEIKQLKEILKEKEQDLEEVEALIVETMNGENNGN